MFLVLLGAALHATWNVIIKAGSDTLLDTVLVAALRETSVIFGTIFASLFLQERFGAVPGRQCRDAGSDRHQGLVTGGGDGSGWDGRRSSGRIPAQ